jgi:hypothetical protein
MVIIMHSTIPVSEIAKVFDRPGFYSSFSSGPGLALKKERER